MQSHAETLAGSLESAAQKWPDKVFLRDGDITVTFAELRDRADHVARYWLVSLRSSPSAHPDQPVP